MKSGSAHKPSSARWLLPIGYMGLIWYMSSRPVSDLDLGFRISDKAMHAAAYAALALFVWWASQARSRPASMAFGVASLYGAVDELHQLWGDAGRYGDVWDWLADVTGAGLMAVFLHVWAGRGMRNSEASRLLPGPPVVDDSSESA